MRSRCWPATRPLRRSAACASCERTVASRRTRTARRPRAGPSRASRTSSSRPRTSSRTLDSPPRPTRTTLTSRSSTTTRRRCLGTRCTTRCRTITDRADPSSSRPASSSRLQACGRGVGKVALYTTVVVCS
ncbi:hypothetical protein PMAYCL1PPCAC_25163 [Pristionchus mayeri]|uniref:Uncharacterized protein n=1 Tax=Pristionchus mayeri TaxID=1317129 RepID=A0AAN5D1U8_9BILA|nr:hypothetical protein PMAYCL1PPCAC_25163 [Pristionchus mayeri]